MRIDRATLSDAIARHRRIDCAGVVLRGSSSIEFSDLLPPVLISASGQFPSDRPERDPSSLSVVDFERLSLVARLSLFREEGFDFLADESGAPGERDAPAWARRAGDMPAVDVNDIYAALLAAQEKDAGVDRPAVPRSLQIVGARLVGGPLQLASMNVSIGIRLIGCVIPQGVSAHHALLRTIDLSGSAIGHGIFATYARIEGSVRLRRVLSCGVVDFGGATVKGVFDASAMVAIPACPPPPTEAFVGDRGLVNLSLSTLQNEARFNQARIYGGLTMKGATVERTLFLTDVVLRSPAAALERACFPLLSAAQRQKLSRAARVHALADYALARRMHPVPGPGPSNADGETPDSVVSDRQQRLRERAREARYCRSVEAFARRRVSDTVTVEQTWLLARLLGESMRARTCALRADGLLVKGSVFATGLRAGGRIRLKYAQIGGGLHLMGARLRSAAAVETDLGALLRIAAGAPQIDRIAQLRSRSLRQAQLREPAENDRFALDIRDSDIRGEVSLATDRRRRGEEEYREEVRLCAEVHRCVQKCRQPGEEEIVIPGIEEGMLRRSFVIGGLAMDRARIRGGVNLRGALLNLFDPALRHDEVSRPPDAVSGRIGRGEERPGDLTMIGAEIGGDLDLRDTFGWVGLDGEGIQVSGAVKFAVAPRFHRARDGYAAPQERAGLVRGRVRFKGARIGGDVTIVFSPDYGPSYQLARMTVAGRLAILPSAGPMERPLKAVKDVHFDADALRRAAERAAVHEVDLRHATATVFGHASPAWPKPEGLVVEGFQYERALDYGPLAPQRRSEHAAVGDVRGNLETAVLLAELAVLPFALAICLGTTLRDIFGTLNLLLLFGLLVSAGLYIALGRFTAPAFALAKPNGIYWLELQRTRSNVYRVRQRVWPLEPYITAARVLRNSGQVQSANWVELERLRRRRKVLSYRHHLPARTFLRLADFVANYGFAPARAIGLLLLVIFLGAAMFRQADLCGYMKPANEEILAQAFKAGPPSAAWYSWRDRSGPVRSAPGAGAPTPYPPFESLPYSADVVVPFLDLGQQRLWAPAPGAIPDAAQPQACVMPWGAARFAWLGWLLQIAGWLLTTAAAVSLVTRAEALIARNEE